MSKIDEAIKKINKKFKCEIIGTKEISSFNVKDYIPWPTPALYYLYHGNMPTQTLWEISGEFSSGKSSLCYGIVGNAQKQFKKNWDEEVAKLQSKEKLTNDEKTRLATILDSGPKKCVYLDAEHSSDPVWMKKNGVDVDNIIFIYPQAESAESLLQTTLDLIETCEVGLLVIDSLATMVSSQMYNNNDLEKKSYCGISKPLTEWTAKVLPMLSKCDCTVICVNQERQVIGAQYPSTTTVGGKGFSYGCHSRISLRKERCLDEKYNEIANNTETIYGQTTAIAVKKNKLSPMDRKLAKFTITFENGIDKYNDVFLMSVSLGIMNQAGAWYSMLDDAGEVITDTEGNLMKWQGKPNVMAYLKSHEDFTQSLITKIEELTK